MFRFFALLLLVLLVPLISRGDELPPAMSDIVRFSEKSPILWDSALERVKKILRINLSIANAGEKRIGSSYLYGKKIWGVPATQIKATERDGKLVELEIMFFNKGDSIKNNGGLDTMFNTDADKDKSLDKKSINSEGWGKCNSAVIAELEKLPGKKRIRYGAGKIRRPADSWQTPKTVFILDAPENEFVRICIVPPEELKNATNYATKRVKKATKKYAEFSKTLDGDVYITNIPMVDQGPKGYCVTATMERVLLYYKIENIDMHKIAELAGTSIGGGTSVGKAVENLAPVLEKYHLEFERTKFLLKNIKSNVDDGVPLLWTLFSTQEYLSRMMQIARDRKHADSAATWANSLKKFNPITKKNEGPHMCMIIGYNMKTKEVCVSNSWGENFSANWVRFEDMQTITMEDSLVTIRP